MDTIIKFLKSRGFMGGLTSLLGLLSIVFGITVEPELVSALIDNVVALITLIGVIIAQIVGIWGRIKGNGPLL